MNRRTRLLSSLLLLAAFVGVPVLLTWRAVRQDRLDRALIAAVRQRKVDAVVTLLKQGADVNAGDVPLDKRPFWRRLFDKRHSNYLPYPYASSSLFVALQWRFSLHGYEDNVPLVKALLDAGADIQAKDQYGDTPLLLAVIDRGEGTVRLLLNRYADVNATDNQGETALQLARERGRWNLIKLLKQAGAKE